MPNMPTLVTIAEPNGSRGIPCLGRSKFSSFTSTSDSLMNVLVSHHGSERPDTKYSAIDLPARRV